jgi:hypothetical protein
MKTWSGAVLLLAGIVAGAAVAVWVRTSSEERPHAAAGIDRSDAALAPTTGEDGSALPAESGGRLGPKLVLQQQDHDFGKMETNNSGRHEFLVTNAGDQPLKLEQGKRFCGCCTCVCTTQLPEGGTIPPGESAPVTLQWNIKRFTGAFYQTSTLLTNDPSRPEVTLGVSGRITPTVWAVPWQLVFSRVPACQQATGEVRVYGYRSERLEITDCRMSDSAGSPLFETEIVPLPADQVAEEEDATSGFLLRVTLKPGLPPGPFQQQIILRTNVDSAATVEVPVEGAIGGDVSVVGPGWDGQAGVLEFPPVAGSRGAERKLMIVVRGPHCQQAEFKPARIAPEFVEIDLGKTTSVSNGALTRTPLTVRIPAGSPPGNHLGPPQGELGRIVIETNHPQQPQLEILLRFAVQD